MSLILLFKIAAAPLLIASVTWLIRRFGPAIGGLVMGIPLITGPISLFTAIEQGASFARQAAVANLAGQISTCFFCWTFARAARRVGPLASASAGIGAFLVATALWSFVPWSLGTASAALLSGVALLARFMPKTAYQASERIAPWWDLPVRMTLGSVFVVAMTYLAGFIGPQLSGLLAPFPVIVLILGVFVHVRYGGEAAVSMMRGVVLGSMSFASFFLVIGFSLNRISLFGAYSAALGASVTAAGAVYIVLHRPIRRWPWTPPGA